MHVRFSWLFGLLLLAAAPRAALSQEPPRKTRVWAAFGLGGGGSSSVDGIAVMGQMAFQKQPHHIAVRLTGMLDPYDSGADPITEASIVYGRVKTGRVGHATIATGLAYAVGDLCTSVPKAGCSDASTLGLPIVAELAMRPLPVAGLGLHAFINLNPKAVFGGVLVFLQVGWLP